jgi:hypothetical protein
LSRPKDTDDLDLRLTPLGTSILDNTVDEGIAPTGERALPYTLHIPAHVAYKRHSHKAFGGERESLCYALSLLCTISGNVCVDPLQIIDRRIGPRQRP